MTTAPKYPQPEQAVRCPKCGQPVAELRIRGGQLAVGTIEVLGFVCPKCGAVQHWGKRR